MVVDNGTILLIMVGQVQVSGHPLDCCCCCVDCRATEEVFQILEDNQVTLSNMKASRYVKAFDKEVDKWERTLSHILEVIEMILQVQKQWMYLEVCV